MLNTLRIQRELLKKLTKGETERIAIQESEQLIYITLNYHSVVIIPKKEFFIDITKTPKIIKSNVFDSFIKLQSKATAAYKTKEAKLISDKIIATKITDGTIDVWLDVDLLKDFGTDVSFKIIDSKTPVFVYENENLVGIVLPIRIAE